jgi:hypothetical protein
MCQESDTAWRKTANERNETGSAIGHAQAETREHNSQTYEPKNQALICSGSLLEGQINQNLQQIDVMIMGGPLAVRNAITDRLNSEPTTNVLVYDGNGGPICALSSLSPDAVIMDLDDMPAIDGMSFSNWVMETHPAMGVILMMPIGDLSVDEAEYNVDSGAGSVEVEGTSGDLDDLVQSIHAVAWGGFRLAIYGYRVKAVAAI